MALRCCLTVRSLHESSRAISELPIPWLSNSITANCRSVSISNLLVASSSHRGGNEATSRGACIKTGVFIDISPHVTLVLSVIMSQGNGCNFTCVNRLPPPMRAQCTRSRKRGMSRSDATTDWMVIGGSERQSLAVMRDLPESSTPESSTPESSTPESSSFQAMPGVAALVLVYACAIQARANRRRSLGCRMPIRSIPKVFPCRRGIFRRRA